MLWNEEEQRWWILLAAQAKGKTLFRWGDWRYLTCSVYTDRFVTLYRKARP